MSIASFPELLQIYCILHHLLNQILQITGCEEYFITINTADSGCARLLDHHAGLIHKAQITLCDGDISQSTITGSKQGKPRAGFLYFLCLIMKPEKIWMI